MASVRDLALELLTSAGYDDPSTKDREAAGIIVAEALYVLNAYVAAHPAVGAEAGQAMRSVSSLIRYVDRIAPDWMFRAKEQRQ